MSKSMVYGFHSNGTDYLCLSDSHACFKNGIGDYFFEFIKDVVKDNQLDLLKENLSNIVKINPHELITENQKEYLSDFYNRTKSIEEKSLKFKDWVSFFNYENGNCDMYLQGFKYILNMDYIMKLSNLVDFAVLFNLDTENVELYLGNNKEPLNEEGQRYSHLQHEFLNDGYFGVTLEQFVNKDSIIDAINNNKYLHQLISPAFHQFE